MSEVCTDNRFEVIAAYKKKLMERTNIETSPDEMAVIDNVLFRFWQLGWLPPVPHGRLIDADTLDNTLGVEDRDGYVHWILESAPTIIPAEGNGCGRCDHCRINETGTCRYAEEDKK